MVDRLLASPHFGERQALFWLDLVRFAETDGFKADDFRPNADAWFDRMMLALEPFEVTVTFCFTPEHRGIAPHHTSAPVMPQEFADFCARMIRKPCIAGTSGMSVS